MVLAALGHSFRVSSTHCMTNVFPFLVLLTGTAMLPRRLWARSEDGGWRMDEKLKMPRLGQDALRRVPRRGGEDVIRVDMA